MPFVSGFLRVRSGSGDRPDNALPGAEGPVDPGYGISADYPDNSLPMPPPGVWPPPVPAHPIVPAPPTTPPGTIWPPMNPVYPDQGLPGAGGAPPHPDQGLPTPQPPTGGVPHPSHPIAGVPQQYWVVVWVPGYGYKYVCVDPSLTPSHPIAMPPAETKPPSTTPVPTPHK